MVFNSYCYFIITLALASIQVFLSVNERSFEYNRLPYTTLDVVVQTSTYFPPTIRLIHIFEEKKVKKTIKPRDGHLKK